MERPGKGRQEAAMSPCDPARITIRFLPHPSCLCREAAVAGRVCPGLDELWSKHWSLGDSICCLMTHKGLLLVLGSAPSVPAEKYPCDLQDDQPRGLALPASAQGPSSLDCALGPRRKECSLAPSFTANNRYHSTTHTRPKNTSSSV